MIRLIFSLTSFCLFAHHFNKLVSCTSNFNRRRSRYLSLPKINTYKRKRLPQRNVDESDDLFDLSPLAYQDDIGSVFLNHSSKYNTKRLKTPRGKKFKSSVSQTVANDYPNLSKRHPSSNLPTGSRFSWLDNQLNSVEDFEGEIFNGRQGTTQPPRVEENLIPDKSEDRIYEWETYTWELEPHEFSGNIKLKYYPLQYRRAKHIRLQFGNTPEMREEMEGHYTGGFSKFTADVMKYVDRWFKHPSLGMEITFEILPKVVEIDVEVDNPLKAIQPGNRAHRQTIERGDSDAELIAIWGLRKFEFWSCKYSVRGTIGAAEIGGVCKQPFGKMMAVHYSMTSSGFFWQCTHKPLIQKSAWTLSHEIGHAIGIEHNRDYARAYGVRKNCNGMMNAGNNGISSKIPRENIPPWSSCAADFLKTPPVKLAQTVSCMR